MKQYMIKIKFKKLSNKAIIPTKGRDGDACFDLYAAEDKDNINALLGTVLVKTNIAIEIPEGYFGKIYTRSGMALKGWNCDWGVIDSNYRGDIGVILRHTDIDMQCINDNSIPLPQRSIKRWDRIAQLAIHKVEDVEFEEVDELTETTRWEAGYGSSGV